MTGVPRLELMWSLQRLGVMGPTCGLTRGVVSIFRGDPAHAWAFNPASFVVVAVAVSALLRACLAVAGKGWAALTLPRSRVARALGVLALLALWANQQAHASFLLHHFVR
ncbi:MAG: DUF2752 domain-containing protein [Acidimicrobiales bacterium]